MDVVDAAGVAALVAVHDEVFGDDNAALGRALLARLGDDPPTVAAVVAFAGASPISGRPGRVPRRHASSRASGAAGRFPRGRAAGSSARWSPTAPRQAADRGFRYLQVDATDESRPILERLGFVAVARTTPVHLARRRPAVRT